MMSKARLETFSDSVMAIVITLLAFDLVVPIKDTVDPRMAWQAITSLLPNFGLFFISFITLSTMWINHHFILNKIDEVSTKMLWINAILLMFVTLVPFATNFLSKNPFNKVSIMFYSALMFIISLMFSKLYSFANQDFKTLFPQTRKIRHIGLVSYALAFFLSVYSPSFGYFFICIPLLIYILPRQ